MAAPVLVMATRNPGKLREVRQILSDLDLHLVAPDGTHFGWYGDTTGYSGAESNPEVFRIAKPAPGVWRVAVQARRGGPGAIPFQIITSGRASRSTIDSGRAASGF